MPLVSGFFAIAAAEFVAAGAALLAALPDPAGAGVMPGTVRARASICARRPLAPTPLALPRVGEIEFALQLRNLRLQLLTVARACGGELLPIGVELSFCVVDLLVETALQLG